MDNEKLLNEVFKLGLKIQLKYDIAVWVHMSGHVYLINIEMAASKDMYTDKIYTSNVYYDYPESEVFLKQEIGILKNILKTGKLENIPVSFERWFKEHKGNKLTKSNSNG